MDTGATVLMAHRLTLVTIAVAGPYPVSGLVGDRWAWEVDGPGGMTDGHQATEAEAWASARAAAWGVLGRLEVPGGGDELRRALAGEGT